jgi:hypothetical protein
MAGFLLRAVVLDSRVQASVDETWGTAKYGVKNVAAVDVEELGSQCGKVRVEWRQWSRLVLVLWLWVAGTTVVPSLSVEC